MKRFFRAIFWRNNPKAGMLFSIVLSAIFLSILLPIGLYVFAYFSNETSHYIWLTQFGQFWPFVLRVIFIFMSPLLLPYILALTWLYTAHVVRQAFYCPKWLAGLIAVVFSNPFIFLVCALKHCLCKYTPRPLDLRNSI